MMEILKQLLLRHSHTWLRLKFTQPQNWARDVLAGCWSLKLRGLDHDGSAVMFVDV